MVGQVRKQQAQAGQGERMSGVKEVVLAERCSLEVEEVEVMCLASSAAMEEAPKGCCVQEAEVGQGRGSVVEEVHLRVLGCP